MVETADFVYLVNVVNPYLPDASNTSKEETVRLIISHATNGKYNPMPSPSSLNEYASNGISRTAARELLRLINKEETSLEEYFSKIGADQLTLIAKKLKNDKVSTDVYRGKVPALLDKLFMLELEEAASRKNKKKQKKPTMNSEPNKAEEIGLTIKDEKGIFDETFNQIKEIKLSYKNSGMRAFALLPVSGMYSHKNLIKLLRKNLARYIFSRKNRAESDDLEELTAEATSELRDFVRECNPRTLLGELLIYIFLEHCERAPKIFTKAEFYKERKSIRQKSIFLREDNGGWQLIVGAAKLNETMEVAISESLKECEEIKNESDFGGGSYSTRFFQNSDLDNRFSTEQIEKIESIMFPSPDVQESPIQVESYGIFLGYQSDNLDGNKSLEDRLKEDAEKAVRMISDSISEYGLGNHPIYVYLLPFKNLKCESDRIIDKLVGR